MNTEHLAEFSRVVECGSFSEAAHGAHLAQSTLSKHVAALEHELGCELLVRGDKGVTATAAGEVLYRRARQIGELVATTRAECRAAGSRGARANVEPPRAVADPALRRACTTLGSERGLAPGEVGALVLYLEGSQLFEVAGTLHCTRDEAAALLGAAYEKLGVSSKQQALDLLYSA